MSADEGKQNGNRSEGEHEKGRFLDREISRREMFRSAGATGIGLALGAGGGYAVGRSTSDSGDTSATTIPFYGRRQAGIATPTQHRLEFAAFDVTTDDRSEARELLRAWSAAASEMCAGKLVGEQNHEPFLPPDDTGEAVGHPPARLTITIGLGPTLFERDGADRFGLAAQKPAALSDLPPLPGDGDLKPKLSGGDLCVQACSDDPQVAFHAVRNLARIARGVAVVRWSQLGFGRTTSTSRTQETARNLMGFKDGTNNIKAEDEELIDRYVWAGPSDKPAWMRDGTYLVARRIRMLIEVWDRASLDDQEQTFGRRKYSGAPLGKQNEYDPVNLNARGPDGQPLIPVDAHIRLAKGSGEEKILRRSYSFTDGMDPERGQLDAGLFFICFQRDPHKQFVPIQRRLGETDALNEYISHTGSALFACPPGARKGGYVGETLFDEA